MLPIKKSQHRNTVSLRKLFKMAQLCHKPSFLQTWKGTTGNVHIKNKQHPCGTCSGSFAKSSQQFYYLILKPQPRHTKERPRCYVINSFTLFGIEESKQAGARERFPCLLAPPCPWKPFRGNPLRLQTASAGPFSSGFQTHICYHGLLLPRNPDFKALAFCNQGWFCLCNLTMGIFLCPSQWTSTMT